MISCMPPEHIENNDLLGRGVFSEGRAKRAKNGNLTFDMFKEKHPSNPISVDRFGFCSDKDLTNIQDTAAKLRKGDKGKIQFFYGWFQIKAENIRRNGREVKSEKTENNPYHAEISLPKNIKNDEWKKHAKELASYSKWRPRGNNTEDI